MPIYEYRCDECGAKFEKLLRSMSLPQPIRCPRCGGSRVAKTVSLCGTTGSIDKSTACGEGSCAPAGG